MCFLITDQCNSFHVSRNDLSLFHLHYMLIFPQPRWNNKRSPRQRSWATIHQKCCKNHSPGSGHLSGNAAPPIPPRLPSPDKKRHAPQGLIKEHALLSYCFYSYHQHSTYSVNNCLWSPCDDCQNSTIYYTKSLLSCQCSVSFYRTQVYLGSDLWVQVSLTHSMFGWLNWCVSGWWRYQLNSSWWYQ